MARNPTVDERMKRNRYIVLRCPMCDTCSPVCDQREDVARRAPAEWWQAHLISAHPRPAPIIELMANPDD